MIPVISLRETDSTNNYIKSHRDEVAPLTLVMAERQTAGRGQRGNSWESEPGKNITLSMRFIPEGVTPAGQFAVSQAVALAVVETLRGYGIQARVKWPNDIYVGDRKIAGILIENSIMGMEITDSIIGIGLNVNQKEFLSDAPNPESMTRLTGEEYDIMEVATTLGEHLREFLDRISGGEGREEISSLYHEALWRGDGRPYPFRDSATGKEFTAVIRGVEPSGHLLLEKCPGATEAEGITLRYAFKEVTFLL